MAGNLQQRLDSIRSKAQLLQSRYLMLLDEKRAADARIQELQDTLERQRKEMDVMQQQIEYLRVVTTITPSHQDVERSRAILSELVRDIDKCISELTE